MGKRGRPKGSKNKSKIIEGVTRDELRSEEITLTPSNVTPSPIIKRGRGRPRKIVPPIADDKYSQEAIKFAQENKSQNNSLPIYTNIRDLKRQIRELRKLKLQCRAGTKERVELHRKMTALKKQLKEIKENKIPENNLSPITYEKKEKVPPNIIPEENCPDSNGCSFFGWCRAINKKELTNNTCYNAPYFIGKLNRVCSELKIRN